MKWQFFRQQRGQLVQEYTMEFRKQATLLGASLKDSQTLMKYIGGLHIHLLRTIMLFNPNNIDQVCVPAQYLEDDGKIRRQYDESKKASN